MTTNPNLPELTYQADRAGAAKPSAATEAERQIVDSHYRSGLRDAGRLDSDLPETAALEESRGREGRIVEDCIRTLYGTPGPERQPLDVDLPHDPGG